MDIVNATKAAIENECAITRPKLSKENIAIMPERCYKVNAYQIIDTAKKAPIRRWAPQVEDITAKDWTIVKI